VKIKMTRKERVRKTLNCESTDRPPLYDNLRNDAVIEYLTGEKLTIEKGRELTIKAMSKIFDAVKQFMRFPQREGTIVRKTMPFAYSAVMPESIADEEGYRIHQKRWTWWYAQTREYSKDRTVDFVKKVIKGYKGWNKESKKNLQAILEDFNQKQKELGGTVLFACISEVGLGQAYEMLGGIDKFSYFMLDEPRLVSEYLEVLFQQNLDKINHLPKDFHPEAVFVPEDIAFKTGTIFPPKFLKREFFPRLKRIVEAYHQRDIKVVFHSDGNLWEIMDELMDCEIDALNPLETTAEMDTGKLRKRYPKLVLIGGIDCSELLPRGTPEKIRKTVRESIDKVKYGYFVGSSSEIHNDIPLENVLAMFEEAGAL
jgi:hypothetical protein